MKVLIRDMKSGLKVQKKAAQKDFLEVCMRKKVFPKDIIMIAKHLAKGDSRKYLLEAKRILRDRIGEKSKEIRLTKVEWNRTSRDCNDILRLSHEGERTLRM